MFDHNLMEHIVRQTYMLKQGRVASRDGLNLLYQNLRHFLHSNFDGSHSFASLYIVIGPLITLGAPHIVQALPRDRYLTILRELHFNDNSTAIPWGQPGHDRAHKVRPVLDSILQKCLTLYKPHKENSVDEAMVKFKGRSSLKQYMPKKPIKRGFKVWCRCDSHNGFTCSFQVYLGATDSVEKDLGIRATLDVTRDVFNKGFHIYCDNFLPVPN